MYKYLFLLSLLFSFASNGAVSRLSEKSLLALAQQGEAPELLKIEAAFHAALSQEGVTKEGFAPELFGRGTYAETNERAIIEFQPVFSPIKQMQLGVKQKFSRGLEASVSAVTDQRSAASPFIGRLQNITTTTLAFTMQMDLWKDLFGRISRSEIENAGLGAKKAELEKDIQTKTFNVALRRIYWALVANQEALKISEELLKTAKTQAQEMSARFKSAVAESDEVARYNAQVASREGTLLYLKFQKETLLQQLKNLLPELISKEIAVHGYDLNQTIGEVLACTGVIASQKNTPFEFTKYDEVISLIRNMRSNYAKINSRYSDLDVKLFGTVRSTGVGTNKVGTNFNRGSYGASIDDMTDTNRSGYEVGVMFNLPLGDVKEKTQKSKELYDEKRLLATINSTEAQMISTHEQLVKSVGLLTEVIRAQRKSSEELRLRLKGMKRKYQQARISVNDLVNDQDAYLSSELTTIETQLQILNTLFDYFAVYTETPCPFNRI